MAQEEAVAGLRRWEMLGPPRWPRRVAVLECCGGRCVGSVWVHAFAATKAATKAAATKAAKDGPLGEAS